MNTIFIEANDSYYRQTVAQIVARYALAHNRNQARIIISVFEHVAHNQSQHVVCVRDLENPSALHAQTFTSPDDLQHIINTHIAPVKSSLARKPNENSPLQRGIAALRNLFVSDPAITG